MRKPLCMLRAIELQKPPTADTLPPTPMTSALKYSFNPCSACMLIEGQQEAESPEQVLAAWQYLIDTGVVWSLQGWYGRRARELIESGECYLETPSQ